MESIIESKMKTAANLFPYETHSLVLKGKLFFFLLLEKNYFQAIIYKEIYGYRIRINIQTIVERG